MTIIIDLSANLVNSVRSSDPDDLGKPVEIRDYDWPRVGDLDSMPDSHEFVEKDGERYVRSFIEVEEA